MLPPCAVGFTISGTIIKVVTVLPGWRTYDRWLPSRSEITVVSSRSLHRRLEVVLWQSSGTNPAEAFRSKLWLWEYFGLSSSFSRFMSPERFQFALGRPNSTIIVVFDVEEKASMSG